MDIQFFGATKMVTGSNYLLTTKNHKILIDCGMFQGNDELEKKNYEDFPYDLKDIDYMILTHAHIDHSGRIPKLVKDGFKGKILCTKATFDLCSIMLLDSAKIQEADAQWENKKRNRAGKTPIEPLYTMKDAEESLYFFQPYFYEQMIKINDEINVRFKDAGHILGSSIVEIWINENKEEATKIVFSGDLGMPGRPIIRNPEYIDDADYLVIESTYGDRNHEPFGESSEKLIDIINKTALRGGTVIIPSFAIGRTQELIYQLNKYYEYNNIEEYMKIPIYIDSPLAIEATEVFQKNSSSFNQETTDLILKGDNPFTFGNLRYVKTTEESMVLNKAKYPKVIISASGMANAGRVRHHLKHNLWDKNNSLVFVGYQAEGTLGRILLDGHKKVKLLGEEIDVKIEIHDLEGFSAHADQNMLIEWVDHFKEKPKKIFIVHGEEVAANTLSQIIDNVFKIETIIPNMGNKYSITKETVEVKKGITMDPLLLKQDIENEIVNAYKEIEALKEKGNIEELDDMMVTNYNEIKNKLIDLRHSLMDINLLISK